MGRREGRGAWPDAGDRSLGGRPLGGPGPPSGSSMVPSSQLSALGSRKVQLQGARAHPSALRCRSLPRPNSHPAAQPHGSHKGGPQESLLGGEAPALQAGLQRCSRRLGRAGPSSRPAAPLSRQGSSFLGSDSEGRVPSPPPTVSQAAEEPGEAGPSPWPLPKTPHFRAPARQVLPEPSSPDRGPAGHMTSGSPEEPTLPQEGRFTITVRTPQPLLAAPCPLGHHLREAAPGQGAVTRMQAWGSSGPLAEDKVQGLPGLHGPHAVGAGGDDGAPFLRGPADLAQGAQSDGDPLPGGRESDQAEPEADGPQGSWGCGLQGEGPGAQAAVGRGSSVPGGAQPF